MGTASTIVLILIAIEHVAIFVVEAFFWHKPLGQKIFRLQPQFADQTRVMAANQGVYNAFLAAGIVFALITDQAGVATFFAACVATAGVVGGLTSSPKIIVIQGVPAILALALLIV